MLLQTLVQKSRAFLDLSQGKVRDSLGKIFKNRDKMQGEAEPWQFAWFIFILILRHLFASVSNLTGQSV